MHVLRLPGMDLPIMDLLLTLLAAVAIVAATQGPA